ncbi:hypothetical protein LIER_03690 [Lithospermum erythrorhizon]|uniref:DUF4218 domain-containing protein n=1 Tax=Lithospermum erythrorhizon TaxID=34254 RepID=A0AAV3NU08_LITER
MTWHRRTRTRPGWMSHPRDGEAWKHLDAAYPKFSAKERNVRVGSAKFTGLKSYDMHILVQKLILVAFRHLLPKPVWETKIFPHATFDVIEHLPVHLPYEALMGGPVHYRWMYPFEL